MMKQIALTIPPIRRLWYDRLAVIAERDELRQRVDLLERADEVVHHRPPLVAGDVAVTGSPSAPDDPMLVERITAAYRAAAHTSVGAIDNLWLTNIAAENKALHELLMSGTSSCLAAVLRDPSSSMLFYGFESLHAAHTPRNADRAWRDWQHLTCYDNLLQLAKAVGVERVENPESDRCRTPVEVEELLSRLDGAFGFAIDFPNPFSGEIGLQTSRGVASYRAIQALYQAWRIRNLSPCGDVLEIGAGLGRTAYYATRMGITSYTIIDIPMTGVAQAYFLGRVLGEERVSVFGEPTASVSILPPASFETDEAYDLIVNVDSLTEMSLSTAQGYLAGASRKAPRMLSINHEGNPFTVGELCRPQWRVWRSPYWMRKGYVEEMIEFVPTPQNHTIASQSHDDAPAVA